MLKEILVKNLSVLFVGTAITQTSDELGFYHLGPNDQFWYLLEYGGLTQGSVVTAPERKVLMNAQKDHVLDDLYRNLFFEKKEGIVLRNRIGLTDLNRRLVVAKEDQPGAEPTADDVQKLIKKVEKYRPAVVAFVTRADIFEKCFKPFSPAAGRSVGKQDFQIGSSEVWLIGSTYVRGKDTDALEQIFEDLAGRLKQLPTGA
jgi:G:T/U-mismatch repair DNA glycosylase